MDRAYAAAYRETYERHWWFRAREAFVLEHVRRLGLRQARILDVGCGDALFFPALEPFGRVEGIEPDPTCVSEETRRSGRVHLEPFETFRAPDGAYDLVLMLDVLEHLDEPLDALRHAASLLSRPNGRLLVTVPALGWLWTAHDAVNHHRRRYRRRELGRELATAGLEPVDLRYLFTWMVPLKLAARLVERWSRAPVHATAIPGAPWNRLLERFARAALRFEARVPMPLGTSVFAEARRR